MQLIQPRLNPGIKKNFHGVRDQDLQQFWDQGSKFKVEVWDQAGENIPRCDPVRALLLRQRIRISVPLFSGFWHLRRVLHISINWLILSIFCIKKFPKPLARSSGAISFGNDTSDGSHSSDLVAPTIRASYLHKTGLLLVDLPAQFSIYFSVKTR